VYTCLIGANHEAAQIQGTQAWLKGSLAVIKELPALMREGTSDTGHALSLLELLPLLRAAI